jgi:hypothetical protein
MFKPEPRTLEKGSTLFLRAVLLLFSLVAISVCALFWYLILTSESLGNYRPILIGATFTTIPFLYIFYQSFQLLNFIDRNLALSNNSVLALQKITFSSFIISGLYLIGFPFIYSVAERDDAPGVILINLIMIGAPLVVGVFASILQKLLTSAIAYKSENELTI